MDGASLDRLSRIVHHLGHHATRRKALRSLAGGGLAGFLARLGTEDARGACTRLRRPCSRPGECCPGLTCRNGRCRVRNDGGGGGNGSCGGTTCPSGQSCCNVSGFSQCIDRDYLKCCRSSICSKGEDCCGVGSCCAKGWKCCGDGRCCPDGWRCGPTACHTSRAAGISAESAESIPFAEPVDSDEQSWIERGWMTSAGTK